MGIFIGLLLILLAIILNYLILFKMEVSSSYNIYGREKGEKIKHWNITYYISWVISIIPIFGFICMALWFFILVGVGDYKCTSKLFKER